MSTLSDTARNGAICGVKVQLNGYQLTSDVNKVRQIRTLRVRRDLIVPV